MKKKLVRAHKKTHARFPYHKLLHFLILILLFGNLPIQNAYSIRAFTESYQPVKEIAIPTPAPFPENRTGMPAPELSATGVMVIDIPSGTTLYDKNPDLRLYPASTTKIMTALVALDEYKLEEVVKVNTVVTEGQVMRLVKDETITVENLLYGILVHSANDAAFALAEHHPEGYDVFINKMNQKAADLHLNNTHFDNPIGFDSEQHYTTTSDLARLALVALQNPTITKIAGVTQITVADTEYLHFHPLKNINELVGKIPGVSGLKTGFTEAAGQSLVTTAQRNGHHVLTVVLKSEDRFGETALLLEWIFANFSWKDMSPSF